MENICPNGWTLPFAKQIDSNRDISNFSPILGGIYSNGNLYGESTYGRWWGSEAPNNANRYYLYHDDNSLSTKRDGVRTYGFYIRCVSEEKTVTDLTYMQDYDTTSGNSFSIRGEYSTISENWVLA